MPDAIADWTALVEACYPERDAAGWDAPGLQVGDPDDPVSTVLVTLDVIETVLAEARDAGADLVLAHHPLLFRPLARLTPATASGRLALRAARERIGVVAAHTNFDAAMPGTTEPIAVLLGLLVYTPTLRNQIRAFEAGGPEAPEFRALSTRGSVVGAVLGVDVVVIVFLMVTKPVL